MSNVVLKGSAEIQGSGIMNSLVNQNLALDSREVAKMISKRHTDLLRDIETYIQYLENAILRSQKSANPKLDSLNFFIPDTYKVKGNNKTYKCYQVTKKGCELIAHKMTGEKGVLFTATYIGRFHDMEQELKQPVKHNHTEISESKKQLSEARLRNSKVREANVLLKIADNPILNDNYKQILLSYASAIIADKPLIPLPVAEEKTYSAGEIGEMLGVSGNKVGRLANEHNLKTEKYGKLFHDKSKYSNKEVETFRYYKSIVPVLNMILQG